MSGLDNILSKIIADAQVAAEQTIAEAKEKADAFLAAETLRTNAEAEKVSAKVSAEAQALAERSRSAAALSTKRLLLQERLRIIDNVLLHVKGKILSLPDKDYFAMLERFILSHAQGEPGTLVLCQKDLSRIPADFMSNLSRALPAPISVSSVPGDFDSGCILIYGKVEYNGTVDALLSENKDALRDLINKELFAS